MKPAVAALMFFTGLLAAPAQSALSRLEHTYLYGNDYVRVADWARACGFHVNWRRGSPIVQVTSRWSTLLFTIDSQKAEINGVTVFLSAPVAARNGDAFVSLADLQTTVQPVLYPPKNTVSVPIMSVCLDPGHGGKDPGNEEGRRQEKDYTLLLAREVRNSLTAAGLKVTLTRNGDSYVPLPDRTEIAEKHDADLFVSLHFNAAIADKNQVEGAEVYCLTPAGAGSTNVRSDSADTSACAGNKFDAKNMLLAYQIQKAIVKKTEAQDRGVKRARFAVLRNARVPAVLVEAGFMSHPQESKRIFDPEYRRKLAQAVADGILAYKKLVER